MTRYCLLAIMVTDQRKQLMKQASEFAVRTGMVYSRRLELPGRALRRPIFPGPS